MPDNDGATQPADDAGVAVADDDVESVLQALDESLNIQALQDRALHLWEVDKASAMDLGVALLAVRDAMSSHGAFAKWWRAAGLEENRVYYCIRLALGKVKPKAPPTPPFTLNRFNLAPLVHVSPPDTGKFRASGIYVTPKGTVATDGYLLARVSLPGGATNAPDKCGMLSLGMASRLAGDIKGTRATVAFDGNKVTATTFEGETTVAAGVGIMPNYERQFDKVAQEPVICKGHINPHNLMRMLEGVVAFDDVKVAITDSFIRFVASNHDGQTFDGLLVHNLLTPEAARAQQEAVEAAGTRAGMAQLQVESILSDVP